jgi:hypothetical protein
MNANGLVRHYPELTGEERFKAIWAADERGDEAEADRLVNAAKRFHLTCRDFGPYLEAAFVLAVAIFAELMEEAAKHHDAWERWSENVYLDSIDGKKRKGVEKSRADLTARQWDLYLAQGFILKTKADGWKLFCQRMGIAPFHVWKAMPGFERLQRALDRVENGPDRPAYAFTRADMVRLMNSIRAKRGETEVSEANLIRAELIADDIETFFRDRARHYGA